MSELMTPSELRNLTCSQQKFKNFYEQLLVVDSTITLGSLFVLAQDGAFIPKDKFNGKLIQARITKEQLFIHIYSLTLTHTHTYILEATGE